MEEKFKFLMKRKKKNMMKKKLDYWIRKIQLSKEKEKLEKLEVIDKDFSLF